MRIKMLRGLYLAPIFKGCIRSNILVNDKPSGGARRDRTDDLMLAKHALSQLSYGPVTRRRMLLNALNEGGGPGKT